MGKGSKEGPESTPLGYFSGIDVPEYEKILNCMRCGLCLPHCPTYSISKIERSSPRGRVALIRAVADGRLKLSAGVAREVYFCLDCRACETACPAGVRVGYLIEAARSQVEQHRGWPLWQHLLRWLVFENLFMHTPRLERVALGLRIYQKTGLRTFVHRSGVLNLLPPVLRFMEEIAPDSLERPLLRTIAEETPPVGQEHARVGFFLGCMMSILFPGASRASIDLLARNGCRVIVPKAQQCCGAPLTSEGYRNRVLDIARVNIALFRRHEVDWIVTDCAACGSALKEYGELLKDDPEHAAPAKEFSSKIRDISEFLADWPQYRHPTNASGLRRFVRSESSSDSTGCGLKEAPIRIAYDQPCHLQHAQNISAAPLRLLKQIPGVLYVDLPESDWCCGSAGVYNITHYNTSMQILDRKMRHVEQASPDILATANPGCLLQLRYGVKKWNLPVQVCHLTEILAAARGDDHH